LLYSLDWVVCMYSSALVIANAPAWLLVHMVSNLYFSFTVGVPGCVMATPAPTPFSVLLPSVYIMIGVESSSVLSVFIVLSVG
jgi:hypothetical protein